MKKPQKLLSIHMPTKWYKNIEISKPQSDLVKNKNNYQEVNRSNYIGGSSPSVFIKYTKYAKWVSTHAK